MRADVHAMKKRTIGARSRCVAGVVFLCLGLGSCSSSVYKGIITEPPGATIYINGVEIGQCSGQKGRLFTFPFDRSPRVCLQARYPGCRAYRGVFTKKELEARDSIFIKLTD